MSAWHGLDQVYTVKGIPHTTKIKDKPEGVGMEIKGIADGQTGVILQIEPQEGKEIMRTKEYSNEYNAGTAILLRLAKLFLLVQEEL